MYIVCSIYINVYSLNQWVNISCNQDLCDSFGSTMRDILNVHNCNYFAKLELNLLEKCESSKTKSKPTGQK